MLSSITEGRNISLYQLKIKLNINYQLKFRPNISYQLNFFNISYDLNHVQWQRPIGLALEAVKYNLQ